MKKIIRWLIIIGSIIVLIKLYIPPKWNGEIPETIKASKRAGAFLWEYQINRIDTIDFTYGFPVFKNIWATKWCDFKRNKLGIIYLKANQSSGNYIRLNIQDQDYLFNTNNLGKKWTMQDDKAFALGISPLLLEEKYPYGSSDTVHYTIYRMKEPYSHALENLIPLFKIELIPK